MPVELDDGCCRSCQGQLQIVEVDDTTITVICDQCSDSYMVEPDAFNDGGMHYWPTMMAAEGD